jgi:hypothetical protein
MEPNGPPEMDTKEPDDHWVGFVGKIYTGNPCFFHVFSIKFDGLSGVNFPIIQFFEIDRPTRF